MLASESTILIVLDQNANILNTIVDNLSDMRQAVSTSDIEATIILLPESSRSSKHARWSSGGPSELRRRVEMPLSDTVAKVVVPGSSSADDLSLPASPFAAGTINLGCFTSYNSCVTATSNCTGHGSCVDKYAENNIDGSGGDKQCFVCYCAATKADPSKNEDNHVHWGGAYCQKIDVSSPFWLLAGTSIILVGLVTGSIAMLYNVGEEKLPGVIGAGVSRTK